MSWGGMGWSGYGGYGAGGGGWGGPPPPPGMGGPPGGPPPPPPGPYGGPYWGPYGGGPRHPMQPPRMPYGGNNYYDGGDLGGGGGGGMMGGPSDPSGAAPTPHQPPAPGDEGPPGAGGENGAAAAGAIPPPPPGAATAGNTVAADGAAATPMDTTPATTINGVSFNIAGQRIPGFNPYPAQVLHQQQQQPGAGTGKKKKKKKNKGGGAGGNPHMQQMMMFQQQQQQMQQQKQLQQQQQQKSQDPSIPLPAASSGPNANMSASAAQPGGVAANASEWPPALREYVNRCFSKCVTDVDKDQVEIILKGKITKAAGDGSLWTKAWDAEPLPATLSTDLALPKKDSNAPPVKFGLKSNRGALGSSSSGFGRNRFGGGGGGKRGGGASPSPPRRRRRRNSSSSSDSSSRNRSNSRRNNDALSPDYGKNPNCIPLGSGGPKKSKFGNKQGAGPSPLRPGRGGAKNAKSRLGTAAAGGSKDVPYFYTDGRAKMTLDDDLASKELKQKRAARFTADTAGNRRSRKPAISLASLNNKLLSGGDFEEDFGGNWEDIHVVGTCQDLEKRYLRLTSAPEAHMVRPPNVLKKSLKMVVDHWKRKQDYHYACGQMKSIRQDLTVQGVRDTFTVQVYETHGRIALEKGDFTEFNQCQSQLKMLYHDIGGDNKLEFLSYRILYYMYTRETLDLTSALADLTKKEKDDECVKFAIQLRDAWSLKNYLRFFRLYRSSPKMTGYLVDWFINRERKAALRTIIKAFRLSVPVETVKAQLAFDSAEDWEKFVAPFGLKYTDPKAKTMLDCKTSMACLPEMQ